jgi:hypothetical protein
MKLWMKRMPYALNGDSNLNKPSKIDHDESNALYTEWR